MNPEPLLQCLQPQMILTTAGITAGVFLLIALVGELFHYFRVRKTVYLMVGPRGRIPLAYYIYTLVRLLAYVLLVWGAVMLTADLGVLEPKAGTLSSQSTISNTHHLVILLDVSPSMLLPNDAGPEHKLQRLKRATEVFQSIMQRVKTDKLRYTVIAYWNKASVVVYDTQDLNVVETFFKNGMTLAYGVNQGESQTSLVSAIELAARSAQKWTPQSATLLAFTDGDVLPETGLTRLPEAYKQVLVMGIGSSERGVLVNNHYSKQNESALIDMASRYGGDYFNANELLPASTLLSEVRTADTQVNLFQMNLRLLARLAFIIGAFALTFATLIPGVFASLWQRRAGVKSGKV